MDILLDHVDTLDNPVHDNTSHLTFDNDPSADSEARLRRRARKRQKMLLNANWHALTSVILGGFLNYNQWSNSTLENFEYNNSANMLLGEWKKPTAPQEYASMKEKEAYEDDTWNWEQANRRACAVLRSTVEEHNKREIEGLTTAHEIWMDLKLRMTPSPSYILNTTYQELVTCSLDNSRNLQSFVNRLKRVGEHSKQLGKDFAIPEVWLILIFLDRLGPQFREFAIEFHLGNELAGNPGLQRVPTLSEVVARAVVFAEEHQIDITSPKPIRNTQETVDVSNTSAVISNDLAETFFHADIPNLCSLPGVQIGTATKAFAGPTKTLTNSIGPYKVTFPVIPVTRAWASRFRSDLITDTSRISKHRNRRPYRCTYCKRMSHTNDDCWYLRDAPPHIRGRHIRRKPRRYRPDSVEEEEDTESPIQFETADQEDDLMHETAAT